MKNFNGYSIRLIFDGDDWRAFLPKLQEVNAFGETPESAIEELRIVWEGYVQRCGARGLPVPYNDEEE